MGRLIEGEHARLPIVIERTDRPNLIVNTPVVLKGKAASLCGHLFSDTLNTITRRLGTLGSEYGDIVTVTTVFLHDTRFTHSPLDVEITYLALLKDGQRLPLGIPGRGLVYIRKPRS